MKLQKLLLLAILLVLVPIFSTAEEVDKGKIPVSHLDKSLKELPWGAKIWDEDEAIEAIKSKKNVLWVDTRPSRFVEDGNVKGAVNLEYDRKDSSYKTDKYLNKDSLNKEIEKMGKEKDVLVAFFCQGPKCHRSYNASFTAIKSWGLSPSNVIWFRAGFPMLLEKIKSTPKLLRKSYKYLTDEADLG